jgi:hypothetical protein
MTHFIIHRMYGVRFPAGSDIFSAFLHSDYIETQWAESASELYRSIDRRLSAKLVPTFEDRGYRVVRSTDPHGCNLDFLDRSRCLFFQVAQGIEPGPLDV